MYQSTEEGKLCLSYGWWRIWSCPLVGRKIDLRRKPRWSHPLLQFVASFACLLYCHRDASTLLTLNSLPFTVVSAALVAMMGRRYLDSRAPMPGAISGLSLVVLVINALYWFSKP